MWDKTEPFRVTAVQHPPVFLDLDKSVDKACDLIAQAEGELIVFPETWLPGYPVWLDVAPGAALWGSAAATAVFRQLFQNSVTIPSPTTDKLGAAARAANAIVVMGLHERDGGTLYNTILYFGADGQIMGKHRKLMPTYTERLVWGMGDGSTLDVFETPLGRIGGLVCWEHWMPLARFAYHQQQELVHIAQWPTVTETHLIASRSYAFEGQCFVVAAGTVLQKKDFSHLDLQLFDDIVAEDDAYFMGGGGTIIGPNGKCLVEPLWKEAGLITAVIDPQFAIDGRLVLDVTGHYGRPDIFQLHINRTPQKNVQEMP